ncbi:MAG: discoidin domain-containing protein [Verrucomicrobiales bacterium]
MTVLLATCSLSGATVERDPSWTSYLDSFAGFLNREVRQLDQQIKGMKAALGRLPKVPADQQSERLGFHSAFKDGADWQMWVQINLGRPQTLDAVALVPCNITYGFHPGPGYGFPVRFKVEISNDPDFGIATLLLDQTANDFPNPGDLPVFIPAGKRTAQYIRFTATRLWSRGDRFLFAIGEVLALHGNLNVAAGAEVSSNLPYNNSPAWQPENATDGQSVLGPPIIIAETPTNGYHSEEGARTAETNGWVQVDLGQALPIEEVRLFPARPADFPARRGFGFPVRFMIEASEEPEFERPWLLAEQTNEDFINPAENPVSFRLEGIEARYIRVTATKWWHRNNDYVFALAEMAVYSGGANVSINKEVSAMNEVEHITWRREALVDGFTSQGLILEWPGWLRQLSDRREISMQLADLEAGKDRLITSVLLKSFWVMIGTLIFLCLAALVLIYRVRLRRFREVELLRTRIAADLHDEIGSNIGSIALLTRVMGGDKQSYEADRELLQEINRTANQTLDSMREIVWLIHPGHDRLTDLAERLREFARQMLIGIPFEFQFEEPKPAPRLSLEFRRNVFLIFKEVLHNITKHAHATQVVISISEKPNWFEMSIRDNGRGFDPAIPGSGHGLNNLHSRAKSLGGKLEITTAPGKGTKARLILPLS